jgi:ubiquinone/menaquinone biosynthesis C-methylase UbiE
MASSQSWDELYLKRRAERRKAPPYVYQHILDALKTHLGFLEHTRVLEVAAGRGATSLSVAEAGATTIALDRSHESVRTMRHLLGKEQLAINRRMFPILGDAFSLPFADRRFDAVFHQGFIEHFRDPSQLLREQNRVLRTGGLLIIQVPQTFNVYTVIKKILMTVGRWPYGGWETQYTRGALETLVRSAGFEVIHSYGFGSFARALARRLGFAVDLDRPAIGPLGKRLRIYTALDVCTVAVKRL